jgi:uncharacterized protein involved in outer membrane biogenesis/acylphosphatase
MNLRDSILGKPLSPRSMKILKWTLISLLAYSIIGFFILPPVLKYVMIKNLSEKLGRTITIQKIKVNPFMLSVSVSGFDIKEKEGADTFFSFQELYVNLQTASIFKRGVVLREVRIYMPYAKLVRNEDLTYNFSDLIKPAEPKKSGSKDEPFRFSMNNIQILNGRVNLWDLPKHLKHTVSNITAMIPFVSNLPYYTDTYVTPMFEARLNDRQISFKGQTKPFTDSLETVFDLNIKDLDIPYYLEYVPFSLDYKVVSAYLDVNSTVSYSQFSNRPPLVSLKGDVLFKDINITDRKDSPLVKLPALDIKFADTDLIMKQIHLSSVSINAPDVNVVRDASGRINLESFIPEKPEGQKPEKGPDESPFVINVDEIGVTQGKISFSDLFQNRDFKTTCENINVTVKHFSNAKDKKADAALAFETESKEAVKLGGIFSLDPLSSEGNVELTQIPLKKYAPYYRDQVLFDIEDAVLGLSTGYAFKKTGDIPEVKLSGLTAALNSLTLRKRGEKKDFLSIPELMVKGTDIDLATREVTVGEFFTGRGVLNVRRSNDGVINVLTLLPAPAGQKPSAPSGMKAEKPFLITVKNIQAEGYAVNFEDLVPSEPVSLAAGQIKITGENLSTVKNSRGKISLSLRLNKSGSVSAGGSLRLNPLSANITLNVKGAGIAPFQPYFTDRVKIIVTGGNIMTKGNLTVSQAEGGGIKAGFKGDAGLSDFASVDKMNADDFLKWQSLYLSGIDAGYNPLSVAIKEIALSDFYSRLIVNQDGTLNVQGIVQSGKAAEAEAATPPPAEEKAAAGKETKPAPVKIDNLSLQGGAINFSDNHIKPVYSANLLEIGGRVSGLSSEEGTTADVDLRGKLENYAPLEITGKINPLREDLYVDLKADFKDMDLSPLTPYSGRYAGYTIEKGKLSLNLQYLIVKKKLDSQNHVFLDQFTFGDTVESPEATKLPVKLAIALLKDRQGQINLDIPVTGEIDDPQFSVWRIVFKIIVNLLVKAATSPFALLGAIFGGGEELGYLEFDHGSSGITAPGAAKLDKLIKALHDRPGLKLEIEGFVDAEKDREGMIQNTFQKKIKAEKLKDMIKKGQPAVPVEEVKIEPEEYPQYLKKAYKEEKFPKPRNIIGIAKDLPAPEMEKLMLTHIEITNDDLRQLASRRSLNIKDYILKSQQVEQERVFLVEPKSLAPEKKENVKDSRVEFKLK